MKSFLRLLRDLWLSFTPRLKALVLLAAACSLASTLWTQERDLRVSGLPEPKRPIAVSLLSAEMLQERIHKFHQSGEASTRMRCRRLGMMSLGLVKTPEPQTNVLPPSWLDQWQGAQSIPAFYIAGSDTIFTTAEGEITLRHEMVHAVEDQYGTRLRDASRAESTDEQLALRAAVEGTATVISKGESPSLAFGSDLDYNAMVLAYVNGAVYVRRKAGSDFQQLLAVRPRSTYSVLFGQEPPVREDGAEKGGHPEETSLCSDRLGPLGLMTAMIRSGAGKERAVGVAEAWVDDRMEVIRLPDGQRKVVWEVWLRDPRAYHAWATGPAAQIPLTAARTYVNTHHVSEMVPDSLRKVPRSSPFEGLGQ